MKKRTFLLYVLRPLFWILSITLFLGFVPYLNTHVYQFPKTESFSGDSLYNPYQDVNSGQSALEVKFYSDATHTNFNTENEGDKQLAISASTHGFNPYNSKILVIGNKGIKFFDFPFFQGAWLRQYLINYLKPNADALAIPLDFLHDSEKLVGYNFIEMEDATPNLNDWDAALSSGKLSWLIANQHIKKIDKVDFVNTNLVYTEAQEGFKPLAEMKVGKMYVLHSNNENIGQELKYCHTSGDTLKVAFSQKQEIISFIGENAKELGTVSNSSSAQFVVPTSEPYVRVVSHNQGSVILLNPIVRWDGEKLPLAANMKAQIRSLPSGILKVFIFILLMLYSFAFFLINGWFKWEIKR